MVTESCHNSASYGGSRLVSYGGSGVPGIANPLSGGVSLGYGFGNPENTEFLGCAYEEMWDAVLTGEWTATVRGKQPCDLKLLWIVRSGSGANSLNQVSGINKGIDAFRKVEFVATNDIVLSSVSKYADVVLPATSMWEKEYGNFIRGNPEMIIYSSQITPPLYEARDEAWMERELAARLGIDPDEVHPVSHKEQIFNQMYGATVITEDGSGYEPLITFTASDISEWGVEAEPQQGVISMQEFMERGIYQVPRAVGDSHGHIGGKAFRDDPEANPVGTASGKLEIHCQALADKIAAYGFDTIAPIAQYREVVEGIEEAYDDWDGRVRGEYPLQLFTQHSYRRSHSVFDNIPQLREAFPQEFIMNPIDAKARGLKQGDTVLVTSRHGKVLRPLVLSERIMPGVVNLMEGAWVEKDDETGIDMAGATNSLNGARGTGQGQEPWNSCTVKVEKWTGEPIAPDKTWPRRIPIKEV
jgi:anaerobic dimethyl sulfoxide reductase subunit A